MTTRPDLNAIRARLEELARSRKRYEVAAIDEPGSREHHIADDTWHGDLVKAGGDAVREWTPALLAYAEELEREKAELYDRINELEPGSLRAADHIEGIRKVLGDD